MAVELAYDPFATTGPPPAAPSPEFPPESGETLALAYNPFATPAAPRAVPAPVDMHARLAQAEGAPADIFKAVHLQESRGRMTSATSINGAQGAMQIIPGTWAQYARAGEDPGNPETNLRVGARIVADLSRRFGGDPAKVAVAYFSGPGNVNTDPSSPTPWREDRADGNGFRVSQYVGQFMARLASVRGGEVPASRSTAPTAIALPASRDRQSVGQALMAAYAAVPEEPKPKADAQIVVPSTKPGDVAKSFAAGAVDAVGEVFRGGGLILSEGLNQAGKALGADPQFRAINPLEQWSQALRDARSAGGKLAEELSTPTGDLVEAIRQGDLSLISFGKDPTVGGVAQWLAGVFGQFAPQVAIALASGGASLPARLAIDIGMPGLQGFGAAAGEERKRVEGMNESELTLASSFYRDLRGQGLSHDAAKDMTARKAELGGGIGGGIPAALAGPLENILIRGGVRMPVLGRGAVLRGASALLAGTGAGAFEGGQELVEGVGQRLGSREAIGESGRSLTEESFPNFAGGFAGGAGIGAGVSAVQGVTTPAPPSGAPARQPPSGGGRREEPIPASDLFGPEPVETPQTAAPTAEPAVAPPVPPVVPEAAVPPSSSGVGSTPAVEGPGGTPTAAAPVLATPAEGAPPERSGAAAPEPGARVTWTVDGQPAAGTVARMSEDGATAIVDVEQHPAIRPGRQAAVPVADLAPAEPNPHAPEPSAPDLAYDPFAGAEQAAEDTKRYRVLNAEGQVEAEVTGRARAERILQRDAPGGLIEEVTPKERAKAKAAKPEKAPEIPPSRGEVEADLREDGVPEKAAKALAEVIEPEEQAEAPAEPAPIKADERAKYVALLESAPVGSKTNFDDRVYEKEPSGVWREQSGKTRPMPSSKLVDAGVRNFRAPRKVDEIKAKARAKAAPSDWTEIGKNAIGQTLYQDQRGVRSYIENGVRITESVKIVPGKGIAVDRSPDDKTWSTTKETADAVQEQGAAEVPARDEPEGGREVRQGDVAGGVQEPAGAREPEGAEARPAAQEGVAPSLSKPTETVEFTVQPLRQGAKPETLSVPATPSDFGKKNTIFTEDRAARAREILKKKLGNLNAGIDPEVVQAGIELAGYYIEGGARKFADYSAKMIGDLGEVVRPYLKSWYLAARNYPGFNNRGMESEADLEQAESAAAVEAAAHEAATSQKNELPEPTEAQKSAGNYAKGHLRIAGLDISIENPAGSRRRPEWPVLKSHYGYIKRSEGADGDHVDVFIRPGTAEDYSGPIFVVDQIDPNTGRLDEQKVMLGWQDTLKAGNAYLENYSSGWKGIGAITPSTVEALKEWIESGDSKRTFAGSPWGARLHAEAANVARANTAALEGSVDSSVGDAEASGQALNRPTASTQPNGLVDIPSQLSGAMVNGVLGLGRDLKVVRGVVQAVPVAVMDDLSGKKFAAENPLNDEAMLKALSPRAVGRDADEPVRGPVAGENADMSAGGRTAGARHGAIVPPRFTLHAGKHTKTGKPIWTVSLNARVSPEEFSALRGRAKEGGGYYSSFRGRGAVPGFIFESEGKAREFLTASPAAAADPMTHWIEAANARIGKEFNAVIRVDKNMGGERFLRVHRDGKDIPALTGLGYTQAGVEEAVSWLERNHGAGRGAAELRSMMVEVDVLEAETGKKVTLKQSADQALTEIDEQMNTMKELLACLIAT